MGSGERRCCSVACELSESESSSTETGWRIEGVGGGEVDGIGGGRTAGRFVVLVLRQCDCLQRQTGTAQSMR